MSADHASPATTQPTKADLGRQIGVAVSAVLAIVGSFIGSGAAGGTPIQDAAGGALAADATLIAPGGGAFGIWSIIYLGLVAYAVWLFFPSQRASERQRRLGVLAMASLLLNAAWILSIQFDMLWLSVPVIVMLLADGLWLGVIAKSTYQAGIGHLMASEPRLGVAALFYLLYPVGLVIFAVLPGVADGGVPRAALLGALFGLFAYGTYDLTNLATLKTWSLKLSLIDMAWGACVSAGASATACALAVRLLRAPV